MLTHGDPGTATAHLEDVRRTIVAHAWAELTGGLPVTASIGAAGSG